MHKRCPDSRADIRGKENVVDSILCKECKECLFINALQLIIQSSTKYKKWKIRRSQGLSQCCYF